MMQMNIEAGDRVILAKGEKAVVREVLDDGLICIVDVDNEYLRDGAPARMVLISSLISRGLVIPASLLRRSDVERVAALPEAATVSPTRCSAHTTSPVI